MTNKENVDIEIKDIMEAYTNALIEGFEAHLEHINKEKNKDMNKHLVDPVLTFFYGNIRGMWQANEFLLEVFATEEQYDRVKEVYDRVVVEAQKAVFGGIQGET